MREFSIRKALRGGQWAVSVFAGVVVAVVVATDAGNARQAGQATLAFAPEPAAVPAAQQATYVLGVAGAERLFGADIEITFDPKTVEVVDADPAKEGVQVQIGPFLDPGFVVYNVADNTTGKLRVAFTQVAPKAPASGAGALLTIDLRATGGGNPGLRVSAALLARDDGTSQPVTIPALGAATPAAPQGSPVANPTQLPTETPAATATAIAAETTTVRELPGTTPATIRPADSTQADETEDDSTNWLPIALVALAVLVVGGAAFGLSRRKNNSNGEGL